jgi:hypothetical protein
MTLDVAVFVFGVLVSTVAGSGVLLLFYGHAFLEEARRENVRPGRWTQRFARFLYGGGPPLGRSPRELGPVLRCIKGAAEATRHRSASA